MMNKTYRKNFEFIFIYLIIFITISVNSKTSLWKLNSDQTKIVEVNPFQQMITFLPPSDDETLNYNDDKVFNIISSTVHLGENWSKNGFDYYCMECGFVESKIIRNVTLPSTTIVAESRLLESKLPVSKLPENKLPESKLPEKKLAETKLPAKKLPEKKLPEKKLHEKKLQKAEPRAQTDRGLDCGKPTNFTYYDNLVGIINRNQHPNVAEPHAALIFINKHNIQDVDLDGLEKKLIRAKLERPKSVQLYNQIGNFWRIKGNTGKAIECFRQALALSPHNADVLLNLGRVLFTLQYLDDAIYLTRRSLEVQHPDRKPWQQHFTLGEIYRAYGHYTDAIIHFQRALDLKPEFKPARAALKELEPMPVAAIHVYTLVIIACLVVGVLLVMISTCRDTINVELELRQKCCNKATGFKTIRQLSHPHKHVRCKKGGSLRIPIFIPRSY